MKLKIETTRTVGNSKVDVCSGCISGVNFETARVYGRASIHHGFKLKSELFKIIHNGKEFSTLSKMKEFILLNS